MPEKYRIRKTFTDRWSRAMDLESVLKTAQEFLEDAGGPYRLKTNREGDEEWGRKLTRVQVMTKLRNQLPRADVGLAWYVDTAKLWHVHIRKVDVAPAIPDSPGTTAIDISRYWILRNWKLESWGVCNCRRIAGSSSWSQHAWCNAEDYHAVFATMEDASRWIATAALGKVSGVPNLPVSQVIFASRIWTPSNPTFVYVSGIGHYDHIHISGDPLRVGTPPCA